MDMMKSKWAMVPVLPLKIRASLNSLLILFYVIFYMFLKLQKIYFLFKNLLLIIMFMWNFTHLVSLLRIVSPGKFYIKARVDMAYITGALPRLYHLVSSPALALPLWTGTPASVILPIA